MKKRILILFLFIHIGLFGQNYNPMTDPMSPLNPSSPTSPMNPANPASPLNPINMDNSYSGPIPLWFEWVIFGLFAACVLGCIWMMKVVLIDFDKRSFLEWIMMLLTLSVVVVIVWFTWYIYTQIGKGTLSLRYYLSFFNFKNLLIKSRILVS